MRALAAALIVCATLYGAPFSHRVHLALKLPCTGCHAAAVKSTSAQDNLLPAAAVCANCHKPGSVPPPGAGRVPSNVDKFSHALHLRMGSVAPFIAAAIDHGDYLQPADDIRRRLNTKNPCEACHRGLEESDAVTSAALPQMADCLVCHTQIDPPFSCADCHAEKADLKPASHTPLFLNDHSTGKLHLDKTTCAVCHGRTFTCMGCH